MNNFQCIDFVGSGFLEPAIIGELAGGGSVIVAVGCWPRRQGGAEGGAAGGPLKKMQMKVPNMN